MTDPKQLPSQPKATEPARKPRRKPTPVSASGSADLPQWVEIARVGRPQGVRGEVNVQLYNPDSEIWAPGLVVRAWQPGRPARSLRILTMRPARDEFVVQFEGLASREDAAALTHALLQIDPAALPPVEEDEVYLHELLGATVIEAETGEAMGTVTAFIETSDLLLDIRLTAGGTALLPVSSDSIEALGREKGKIVVRHLEDWRST